MSFDGFSNFDQTMRQAAALTKSRAALRPTGNWFRTSPEAEGGCGVTGFACTVPVGGHHIFEPSIQMRNRGNGKGGGIAACGLVPEDLGVSRQILEEDYILQIALLDPAAQKEIEEQFINPFFDIHQAYMVPTLDDHREVELLEIRPPDVMRYFVRVKKMVLDKFRSEQKLESLKDTEFEDEFVYQNSIKLNTSFYASKAGMRAFVMSHAKNLIIMKIVGFAEASVQYYKMHNTRAHVWIAHQRFPTKGRVWHPGGAHPFIGMNEALVHNGDFANYHSVCEYLAGRNLFPKFMTDTEVSVLIFDLLNRTYKYPLEYIIEALAPTTETDFDRLPVEKQRIYRQIQAVHVHASPDGPWFFIIARSLAEQKSFQLLGITDTAMLRPQVFALQDGEVKVGLICSEKQAIDATLASLSKEDPRIAPIADHYWNARGGSAESGGSFLFSVAPTNEPVEKDGIPKYSLKVEDKFGGEVTLKKGQTHCNLSNPYELPQTAEQSRISADIDEKVKTADARCLFQLIRDAAKTASYDTFRFTLEKIAERTFDRAPDLGIEALTLAIDLRYPTGDKKRSSVITIIRKALEQIFTAQPLFIEDKKSAYRRITFDTRDRLRGPEPNEKTLLIDARKFDPQGDKCDARIAVSAYKLGWRHFIHYNSRGTRFHAAGFGPSTTGLRVDCYDNPGDYLGSGMDGLEVFVHGNAQDQLSQIAKEGKLVVYGDVGQTFLYGAKGSVSYVMGNTAGRPLINAVGRPKAVINGTTLDYLAESFMAGDPLTGGGFVVMNGLAFNDDGAPVPLDMPYPGGNLLSLASGGAVYLRDPKRTIIDEQLNGGMIAKMGEADWKLILPYLEENERLFDIRIDRDLLTVDGKPKSPFEVYCKVMPKPKAKAAPQKQTSRAK
jgi:glutamate synthase domain-containing protein 1/glutamate synthase domain-containing protein 3